MSPPPHRSEGTQLPGPPRASPEPDTKSSEPEDGEARGPEPPPDGAWGSDSSPASRPPGPGLSRTPRVLSALMLPSSLQTEPHPLPAEVGLPQPLGSPLPRRPERDTLLGRVGSREAGSGSARGNVSPVNAMQGWVGHPGSWSGSKLPVTRGMQAGLAGHPSRRPQRGPSCQSLRLRGVQHQEQGKQREAV